MEPRVFSPTSPAASLSRSSFNDTISFSPSDDSMRALLSSHDYSDHAFDAYTSDKFAHEMQYVPHSSPISTASPTPTASERSSLEEDHRFSESPSQATITPAIVRAEAMKLKKKRSLGQALKSLRSSSRDFTGTFRATRHTPLPLQLEDTSILTIDSLTLPGSSGARKPEEEDAFEDRNRTVRRRNMPHHPFRSEDVPYMQAYSTVLLENDYQTHQLLCRLMGAESPTFHKFKKPPSEVLDLGCGEGFWVLHAAKTWKSSGTRVTGLDLIDVHNNEAGQVHPNLEPAQVPKNVTWLRANFVKYALPFVDNTFDLVRMANLTLCIPISRWRSVLMEVRRILKPGGRLELIDDDVLFPRVLPRPSREPPHSPPKHQWQRTVSAQDVFHFPKSPSLSRSLSFKSPSAPSSPHGSPEGKSKKKGPGHTRSASDVEFSTNSAIAAHLENIFEKMLKNKYGISTHQHLFLEQLLREVFGPDCARQTQKLELAVPSRELSESFQAGSSAGASTSSAAGSPGLQLGSLGRHMKRASEDEKHKGGWTPSLEWESPKREKAKSRPTTPKKEKDSKDKAKSRPTTPIPISLPTLGMHSRSESEDSLDLSFDSTLSGGIPQPPSLGAGGALAPKARQLLFGLGLGEGGATEGSVGNFKTPSWRESGPFQPPGLVLMPSTLIPCGPMELEMHACKHMNTLLGCKYALGKYVAGLRDVEGAPLVTEKELDDFLWDYECFRRKRFNWPQDVPGLRMEDEGEEGSAPAPLPAKSNIFNKFTVGTPPATDMQRTLSSGSTTATSAVAPMYGGVNVTKGSTTHVRTIRVYEAMKAQCHCNGPCS